MNLLKYVVYLKQKKNKLRNKRASEHLRGPGPPLDRPCLSINQDLIFSRQKTVNLITLPLL